MRITCHPAKPTIRLGYQFSPTYYDVTEIVEYNDGLGDVCCLENWKDCLLYAHDRGDLDRMEALYQKLHNGSQPIHLAWNGQDSWGNIYTIMAPPTFKHGDPIYFNVDTKQIEF